jgi:hypothetical protein
MRGTRRIRRFLALSGVKSALSTLILLIPIVTGFWGGWMWLYKLVLLLALASANFVFVYYDNKQPAWNINHMLELMLTSLWGKDAHHFRSNVMIFNSKTKKLYIKYSCHMQGAVDRSMSIDPSQGCAGEAYRTNNPVVVDLTTADHSQYRIDPTRVWKLMKSVMSVPICDDENHEHVIGALNIDGDVDCDTAGYFDDKVLNTANDYADLIGERV